MLVLLIVIIACIVLFFYLRSLLRIILFKYMDRIATMPLMTWIPFYEICYQYFDHSTFWTQVMLLTLMKGKTIEARLIEGFEGEGVENPTFEELRYRSDMTIYEFRLKYKPRRKRKIKLASREWFELEPALQPM